VPRREDFFNRIGEGEPKDKLDVLMNPWLKGLQGIVSRMKLFIEEGQYGKI
jgi:hypothetical protein